MLSWESKVSKKIYINLTFFCFFFLLKYFFLVIFGIKLLYDLSCYCDCIVLSYVFITRLTKTNTNLKTMKNLYKCFYENCWNILCYLHNNRLSLLNSIFYGFRVISLDDQEKESQVLQIITCKTKNLFRLF